MPCFCFRKKQCWWHTSVSAIAEQCWTKPRSSVFQLLLLFCQQWGLRGHKELGKDRIRTADLNWRKRYSIPYTITWNSYKTGELARGHMLFKDWLGICWWVISVLFISCVNMYVYIYLLCACVHICMLLSLLLFFLSFTALVSSCISTQKFCFVFFPNLSPIPLGGGS